MLGRKQRRDTEKKLKKTLGKLNANDTYHLMMATQQQAVADAVQEQAPKSILLGMETAMILIYETYLEPLGKNPDMLEQEKQKHLSDMVNYISTEYLKAKTKREEEKARVAFEKQKIKDGDTL